VTPADLHRALRFFAVPESDVPMVGAADAAVRRDSALAGWVTTTADTLREAVGTPSPPPALTSRPEGDPEVVAYLPVLAFAEVLPATLVWSRERGIPGSVVAATMRDVGRMLTRNRRWFGHPGLDDELAAWLTRHLVGSIHEVGRLQVERGTLGPQTTQWLREHRAPVEADGPEGRGVLLHIPDGAPLTPQVVSQSVRAARSLLRRRVADEPLRTWVCISWMLDPQLAAYLPASSNLLAFQRRFRVGPAKGADGDLTMRKFVFGDTHSPVDALPQTSTLQRAVVQHWRAGGRWYVHPGWLDHDTT